MKGAQLYKTAISSHTSLRNFGTQEIQTLFEFYHRSTTDLALQYINHLTKHSTKQHKANSNPKLELKPLTAPETERLIHETTQKERILLKNAVDNKILTPNDPVLSKITARFSIDISGKKNLKILL